MGTRTPGIANPRKTTSRPALIFSKTENGGISPWSSLSSDIGSKQCRKILLPFWKFGGVPGQALDCLQNKYRPLFLDRGDPANRAHLKSNTRRRSLMIGGWHYIWSHLCSWHLAIGSMDRPQNTPHFQHGIGRRRWDRPSTSFRIRWIQAIGSFKENVLTSYNGSPYRLH